MSKTTIQASDIQENLENQGIACNNSTKVSTEAENFYPLARLKLVRKAVCCFSKEAPEDQINIKHSPDLIKFGMQSTQLAFVDKHCEHNGDRPRGKRAHHSVGRCESSWLADLAGAWVMNNTNSHFRNAK